MLLIYVFVLLLQSIIAYCNTFTANDYDDVDDDETKLEDM